MTRKGDEGDCESVQFLSGLALQPSPAARTNSSTAARGAEEMDADGTLTIAYGVNDCEARLGTLPMDKVWAMLRPLEGAELVSGDDDTAERRACWGPLQSQG